MFSEPVHPPGGKSPLNAGDESSEGSAVFTPRLAIRIVSLAVLTALCLRLISPDRLGILPSALSPWLMVCSLIVVQAIGIIALAGLPVMILVVLVRRGFCRYLCPTGLLIDSVGALRSSMGHWLPRGRRFSLTQIKHRAIHFPRYVNHWIAIATMAAALFGWPALLWMDPLAIFSGFFGLAHWPATRSAAIASALLPLLLLVSLFWPRLWCGKICPLGGMQDLLILWKKLLPTRAPAPVGSSDPGRGIGRRTLLAGGAGLASALWAGLSEDKRRLYGTGPDLLRPPGAKKDAQFCALCVRCGNCARVCPTGIIVPDLGQGGMTSFLSPRLDYTRNYCLESCNRCGQVCPSGALARMSIERKKFAGIGIARLSPSNCLRSSDQECSACVPACPYDAVALVFDQQEYTSLPKVSPARCNGCGACQIACPAETKALIVEPLPETYGC